MHLTVEKIFELVPYLKDLELDIRHLEISHIVAMDRRLRRLAEVRDPWARRRLDRLILRKLENPNLIWNSRGEECTGFKRLLAGLVGWYSQHPEPCIRSHEAWNIIFYHLHPLLCERVAQLRSQYAAGV